MFIQKFYKKKTKEVRSILLMKSYREGSKIKHETLMNLSRWSPLEIQNMEMAIKATQKNLTLTALDEDKISVTPESTYGPLAVVKKLADRLGITAAIGENPHTANVLLMMAARLVEPGSKCANVRWAQDQATQEILDIDSKTLDENDLYKALDFLEKHQESIEQRLFAKKYRTAPPTLVLYDVTSSYLEGVTNELSTFGYNRDGKKGKRQIVIGLLTDAQGTPVAVRVFQGNTVDTKTVPEQIRILAKNFGVEHVTVIGDKGMLKGPQIEDLTAENFHYITSLSKPQIRKLLEDNVLQYDLFDETVAELGDVHKKVRYLLRCNPKRRDETRVNRRKNIWKLAQFAEEQTRYLAEGARRKTEVALRRVQEKIERYRFHHLLSVEEHERTLTLELHADELEEKELLDGCYVITTDVTCDILDTKEAHERYKALAQVEHAFRVLKSELEIRPLYHVLASRTRGHVFMCMLAYLIHQEFERLTQAQGGETTTDHWRALGFILIEHVTVADRVFRKLSTPSPKAQELLKALRIRFPKSLP